MCFSILSEQHAVSWPASLRADDFSLVSKRLEGFDDGFCQQEGKPMQLHCSVHGAVAEAPSPERLGLPLQQDGNGKSAGSGRSFQQKLVICTRFS